MIFTSFTYLHFFLLIFTAYWLVRRLLPQNILLLAGSYLFYGWVTPWFCLLIGFSTVVDYFCGLGMRRNPARKKIFLITSLFSNLGLLGVFKYFNFFADSVSNALAAIGLNADPVTLQIILPVGISFYTFQTLSYTIDIYRDECEPRTNFIDFAVFVSFFPQLVAGPIERAKRFLPQVEAPRYWKWSNLDEAWPLIVRGYLKKLVVADNVAVLSDKIFMLESPSLLMILAGSLAFAVQIYADFSAYTDIARGSARLLGFQLIENFKSPYLAISPSDFWRRWHISFSSWIRDYLYISLGGSRVGTGARFLLLLMVSMGLSGLWHGASWHFVIWGLYHGILVFAYHRLGLGGRWRPEGPIKTAVAWTVMFGFTLFGWVLFRVPDMGWFFSAFGSASAGFQGDLLVSAVSVIAATLVYSIPLFGLMALDRINVGGRLVHSLVYGVAIAAILTLAESQGQDFIYFQF